MNRFVTSLMVLLASAGAFAAPSDLLPGSINFNSPDLWGKEVSFGLDDNGNRTGATRWYSDDVSDATVQRFSGKATGYLLSAGEGDIHRSLMALGATEEKGPEAANGRDIPTTGLYFDSTLTLYANEEMNENVTSAKDKIVCWLYQPADSDSAQFVVTAGFVEEGGSLTVTNYMTTAKVYAGQEFRLTIHAVTNAFPDRLEGLVGFEVSVNGARIACEDGTDVFPSMVEPSSAYAAKIYSFGVSGSAKVNKINVLREDPTDDPTYDQDDVSMLREVAELTVTDYPVTSEALRNFPMLVRISESRIQNFYYDRVGSNGASLRFTDENGQLLPFEIDTWNPEGESLVWVKVPYFRKGAKIRMHWALASGKTAPTYDSASVWSDYVAVWHFNDAETTWVATKDATGHGFTATRTEGTIEALSFIGGAGYIAPSNAVVAANYEVRYPTEGTFTYSGWYKAPGIAGTGMELFGKKINGVKAAGSMGWCGVDTSFTNVSFHTDGSDSFKSESLGASVKTDWFHIGFVADGGTNAQIFANGTAGASGATTITSVDTNLTLMASGVAADEVRISRVARSADWLAAEYAQVADAKYVTYGAASAKDNDNYWIEKPSVTPTAVAIEEVDTQVVFKGRPRYGVSFVAFYDAQGVQLKEQPRTPGAYRMVATVPSGVREGLQFEVAFVIFEKRGYRKISGHDRVMLFNDDCTPDCPVTLQGFYDVDSATNEVWTHSNEAWKGAGKFVKRGTTHVYWEPESQERLWTFRNARIGNLFRSDHALTAGMNFLPWGGNAMRFDDSEMRANAQRYAGTLILQNVTTQTSPDDPAAAYSPYYRDGIGTIYFDAVNSSVAYVNKLKVQICGSGDEDVTAGEWTDVPLSVFAVVDGRYDDAMSTSGVTEVTLAMAERAEGTTNDFYRIRACIDTNVAVRVRIVRTDDSDGWATGGGADGDGLVIIDNIIVSYPAMGVKISSFGAPADPDYPAEGHLGLPGQRAPFDVAFPTAADLGQMHACVKVTYIANNTNANDSSFIGALTLNYRWRYLNQVVGDWKELLLQAAPNDATTFVSTAPIEGEGVGDIEYRAKAVVNAPFYEYWDYSGLGLSWKDFTERRGDVEISAVADGVYSSEKPSPAFGTDYFVRLRDGKSDYEGFRLFVKRADANGAAAVVPIAMELCADNTWRGFYQTATNVEAGLLYRIEAVNHQTKLGDYQWTTNYYCGIDQKELPANDVLNEATASDWAALPCDALTGYLMFQVEDTTRSLTIIHADYQNFNRWSDARLDEGSFLGTSVALPTSGVSRAARSFDEVFDRFEESEASNGVWWVENFDEEASETGKWAIEIPFTGTRQTPNGWTAGNGMWVSQNFRMLGGDSMAFQMKGEGYGSVLFPQVQTPRGVESFTYSARVAQSFDIHSFNYYAGTTNDVYALSNYTFAVVCSMTTTNDTDFTGLGTVSAVANYRDSVGGYEARVERTGATSVQLCLYKWRADGSSEFLGRSPDYSYSNCGFPGRKDKFAALFISCTNLATGVGITAGILSNGRAPTSQELSGENYFKVCYEDTNDVFRAGTFGVGSKDCPAVFARPVFSRVPVQWATNGQGGSGNFHYWTTASKVTFSSMREKETVVIPSAADYYAWNVYRDRLDIKDYSNDLPRNWYGFKAKLPEQYVLLETSPRAENEWTVFTNRQVESFNLDTYVINLYAADDLDVRIRTGEGKGSPDVVVDNLSLRQWRGEDYDDDDNPDHQLYPDIGYGAPTNFVYTTAWVHSGNLVELSPMRTTVDRPAGVRSPLMDGLNNRGLGLGVFSFAYQQADRRARLLVQIATNAVDVTTLSGLTETILGWDTVATVQFDEKTEDERVSGIINTYVGLHGVKGVMRVIVDPTLVTEARDPDRNPENDPTYGQIFLSMAGARDNPVLDKGSWWGWNLRTTDDKLMWLLKDGSLNDTRVHGLAYALNNSITEDIRDNDEYKQHKPFLQTPIFTKGVVGEITFKARRYKLGEAAPTVSIYGTTSTDPEAKDSDFEYLGEIVVDCDRYETFTYQAPVSKNYTAFRLAVNGVDGIIGDGSHYPEDDPPAGRYPEAGNVRRVLIDEVAIFEAIRARLGFRNVGAFRSRLADNNVVVGMPSKDEQPLCNEAWGVQTELYAAQLSEKIDLSTPGREPRVFFHWFAKTSPWGYYNWQTNALAGHAELSRAANATNLVFRSSSLASPEAVVEPSTKPEIVQYSLDVVYYMVGQDDPLTNTLASGDWVKPSWYEPIDCNEQYGNGQFSAYTILDTIAPGWAWFNEVNLFGAYDGDWNNTDMDYQYLEVAAPSEADMTDWSIRMIVPETGSLTVRTNTVATFGYGDLEATKKDLLGQASGMVFRVVASWPTFESGKLSRDEGTIDGTWTFPDPDGSVLKASGRVAEDEPFGIQLVRPSGIVEHEIVCLGTNFWGSISRYPEQYDPSNTVAYLNRYMKGAHFFHIGSDDGGEARSIGVWDSRGQTSNVWAKAMVHTPGRINTFPDGTPQILPPEHPTPYGTTIFIYANLGAGGHITQTVGDVEDSTLSQILILQRGSQTGTDIVYKVDRWYELGPVTTNGVEITLPGPYATRAYRVTIGKGVSNNVTVVANAQPDKRLREALGENNRYTDAIMDWFNEGVDMYGNPWRYEGDDGVFYRASYLPYRANPEAAQTMDLTTMYWLDMCPTISNQYLIAGFSDPVREKPVYEHADRYHGDCSLTNRLMTVFMAISNGLHATAARPLEAPYVIRGVDPKSSSWDYATSSGYQWTNATFKITGILANGLTSEANADNWVALRWFVFDENSFYTPENCGADHEPYTSVIEIVDPYSPESQGYIAGWGEWFEQCDRQGKPYPPVFHRWAIDEKMRAVQVEVLRTNSCFEVTSP